MKRTSATMDGKLDASTPSAVTDRVTAAIHALPARAPLATVAFAGCCGGFERTLELFVHRGLGCFSRRCCASCLS